MSRIQNLADSLICLKIGLYGLRVEGASLSLNIWQGYVCRIRTVCHSETGIHQLPQGRDGKLQQRRYLLVRGARRAKAVDILDPGGLPGANVPRPHVSEPLHRHGKRKSDYQGRRQEGRGPLRVQRH